MEELFLSQRMEYVYSLSAQPTAAVPRQHRDMPLCHSCTVPYGKGASNLFSRPSIHCTPRLVRTLATTNNIAVNICGKRLLTGEQLPKIDMNFHFDIQCQIIFIQDYEIYLCTCACLFPSLQAFHINKYVFLKHRSHTP